MQKSHRVIPLKARQIGRIFAFFARETMIFFTTFVILKKSGSMFQKATKSSVAEGASINLIGSGTSITGDITSNGDVRIDGNLKGNISITGKLVIGPSGTLEGNVQCQNADISGEVKGKLNVTELLSLKATARLLGDIVTGKISVEPNATFTGTCNMGAVVKTISNGAEPKQETAKTA